MSDQFTVVNPATEEPLREITLGGWHPLGELDSSVRVATPFGGVKQSGLGRELGMAAMDAYSELKNVFIRSSA